jgi:hypothetical protein
MFIMSNKRLFRNGYTHFGENGDGHDFKVYGDTADKYMFWDASANTLTVTGTVAFEGDYSPTSWANVAVTGTLSCTGNFSVNTNKFTVDATSGDTTVGGALMATGNFAVNTSKFTVNATSGNTVVAGTLKSTGNFTVGSNKVVITAASGNIAIAGDIAVSTDKFTVAGSDGDTAIAGTLDVTGLATLKAGVKLSYATGSTTEGVLWYDATAHVLKYYDGTAAKTVATTA